MDGPETQDTTLAFAVIENTKFIEMPDLGRSAEASDPGQHVFRLIGLFQPEVSKLRAPNYDASISEGFRDFTLSVIEVSGGPDIICHGRKGNGLEESEMPSWMPSWSQKPGDDLTTFDPVFHATEKSNPVQEHSENENLLKCQGIVVDRIDG
jgi:hypothetical protein